MEDKAKRRLPPPLSGSSFGVVALAASAGGLTAIGRILSALPVDLPAAIVRAAPGPPVSKPDGQYP
jgi:two-component system chemotaxis response regulator CheB